jgi:transcriptional regulator with XRE-family HTH domain
MSVKTTHHESAYADPAMLTLMPRQKQPASDFGARLIALRKGRGMTQIQLAQATGLSQRMVSYYEADADVPAGDLVVNFANALGTTTDELLGAKPASAQDGTIANPAERRTWRRFRQLMELPEKDRKAVMRMLDTMTKAHAAAG